MNYLKKIRSNSKQKFSAQVGIFTVTKDLPTWNVLANSAEYRQEFLSL